MKISNSFRSHGRNTVRYYLILISLLAFLFFSNDFGLIDVQKTAIVMAVGIDKEEDTFIVTSQIAIPQSSKQGKATEAVQIVSRGNSVADAFKEINAKTGWYPKLVFCNLILLGEFSKTENVFSSLDFFLRDEYLSDDCLVATCEGKAKDILNTKALVDPSASVAIQKVLSAHAERVGTVLPSSLRSFSIGYFSDSQSGFLPILKTQPQQERIEGEQPPPKEGASEDNAQQSGGSEPGGASGDSQSSDDSSSKKSGNESGQEMENTVFSASETALFVDGVQVGTFNQAETFAFGCVMNNLQLAPYTVQQQDAFCTLNIRQNQKKLALKVGDNDRIYVKIDVVMTAGITDYSKPQDAENLSDAGDVPNGVFTNAEKKLKAEIIQVFDKCKMLGCDLFGIQERLLKQERKHFYRLNNNALDGAIIEVNVRFQNVR